MPNKLWKYFIKDQVKHSTFNLLSLCRVLFPEKIEEMHIINTKSVKHSKTWSAPLESCNHTTYAWKSSTESQDLS